MCRIVSRLVYLAIRLTFVRHVERPICIPPSDVSRGVSAVGRWGTGGMRHDVGYDSAA
jgi:hypothetical protein